MKKYLIFAPSYDENSGGIVVLHKLCHLLNSQGYEAFIFPYFENFEVSKENLIKVFIKKIIHQFKQSFKRYRTNKFFNTPVKKNWSAADSENFIVVYPEIVFGNPLGAKHVVRWLLHQPGFHTGKIYYGGNELYYKFNSAIDDFCFPSSKTSEKELKIIHYPTDIYYPPSNKNHQRKGTAYCLRKGKDKIIQHELKDSILIDRKSHAEIAEIFRNVKTFVSYDTYTAYSIFAVLCGAESIVVPDQNTPIDDWYPNHVDRYGISYGFSEKERVRAVETKDKVLSHIVSEERKSIKNVIAFAGETQEYFGC